MRKVSPRPKFSFLSVFPVSRYTVFIYSWQLTMFLDYQLVHPIVGHPRGPFKEAPAFRIALFADRVSAGFPSPATDYLEPGLDLNEFLVNNKAASFLFTVTGESMMGAGIMDGDKVIVDRSVTPRSGDIVIAAVDNEYTIKRLRFDDVGVSLVPANPRYETITLSEGRELVIWGVVTGVVRKYR